jgi:hypothetical protein
MVSLLAGAQLTKRRQAASQVGVAEEDVQPRRLAHHHRLERAPLGRRSLDTRDRVDGAGVGLVDLEHRAAGIPLRGRLGPQLIALVLLGSVPALLRHRVSAEG